MRRRQLLALAFSLPFTAPRLTHATVMLHRSVDELAAMADAVVVATAPRGPDGGLRASSAWRAGRIFTDVGLTVNVPIAGPFSAGAALTVRLPGGVVGDVGQTVAGAPVFRAGETYVVFLQRLPDGSWAVLDMAAGLLPVSADPVRGMTVFPSRADGITFVEPPGGRVVEVAAGGEALVPFVDRLRRAGR
jgi:hypothetical protein